MGESKQECYSNWPYSIDEMPQQSMLTHYLFFFFIASCDSSFFYGGRDNDENRFIERE